MSVTQTPTESRTVSPTALCRAVFSGIPAMHCTARKFQCSRLMPRASEHRGGNDTSLLAQACPVTGDEPSHRPSVGGQLSIAAAGAVHEARVALEHITGQLPEMHAKAKALDELRVKLDLVRARRAQMLEDALLADGTADTTAVDKEIGAAERALEKRQDEATAVSGALRKLETQRQAAATLLSEREVEYKQRLEEHDREIARVRWLTQEFHEAVTRANSRVAEMPTESGFRERLIAAAPELLSADEAQMSAHILQDLVTSQADAQRLKAQELAAIPQPAPFSDVVECVWSDGTIHNEPEPPPANQPIVIRCGRVNDNGLDARPGMISIRRTV